MSKAKYWFDRAQKEHFAIGAFNAATIETLKAIVFAAQKLKSPVMVEASHGEATYFGVVELAKVVRTMEQSYGVPVILNLDHAPSYESCLEAMGAGFDYIHFDGSKLPIAENIKITKQIVEHAHARDIMVEGEIDNINVMGASSSDHRLENLSSVRDRKYYTDPEKAADFIEKTGVDTFASFVGNVHGLYAEVKDIDLELLQTIKARLGTTLPAGSQVFLSLHGGSGIPDNQISAAIGIGIQKINVNSEIRIAFRDKLKEVLDRPQENEVAIYKIMPEAIAAMQEIVEAKIKLFGSANKL